MISKITGLSIDIVRIAFDFESEKENLVALWSVY